jgi:hypothetical protein
VLVPYILEAELWLLSRSSIDSDRENKRTMAVAADCDDRMVVKRDTANRVRARRQSRASSDELEWNVYANSLGVLSTGAYA